MRGSRTKTSEREYLERRKRLLLQEVEAVQRKVDQIADEIAARSTTPGEAVHACQLAVQFHSFEGQNIWRLIERVVVAMHEKTVPK